MLEVDDGPVGLLVESVFARTSVLRPLDDRDVKGHSSHHSAGRLERGRDGTVATVAPKVVLRA